MTRKNAKQDEAIKIPIEDGIQEEVDSAVEEDLVEAVEDEAAATIERPEPEQTFPAIVVQRLEAKVDELEKKLQATYSAHRGREQELTRIRERLERDREKKLFQEKARLFERLLEPLDNLERSLQAAELSGDLHALLEGVGLVYGGIQRTFSDLGLERFGEVGELFDPEVHEAISVAPVKNAAENDRIHMVYLPGYRLADAVIRPARVVVGKKN
jgi:molecular chaperone GrpE